MGRRTLDKSWDFPMNAVLLLTGLFYIHITYCHGVAPLAREPKKDLFLTGIMKELLDAKQGIEATKLRLDQAEKHLGQLSNRINSVTFNSQEHKGFDGHKLVHFDLGGAAPKMDYLLELVPFLHSWGATGLLIEYVDMFPYSGDLGLLKSPNAYRLDELVLLQSKCQENNMTIIPLIQTFGHLEFVLKHQKFAYLRETKRFTNSLCPNKNDSIKLVQEMLNQVIDAHPNSSWLHVGGDEVWNLKTCNVCRQDARDKSALFRHHMLPLLTHVKSRDVSAIIWDDMMRDWKLDELKQMADLVEPMLWGYKPTLKGFFPPDLLKRYGMVFKKVWMASAFKGAHKPMADLVPIRDRLRNNLKYLEVIANLPSTTTVMGIALTGWSRYDYFGTLCELLPAGIPSLAICLTAISRGLMNENLLKDISAQLGFSNTIDIEAESYYNADVCNATFPGHEVFKIVCKLSGATHQLDLAKETEKGWILPRQLQSNYISYFRLQFGQHMSEGCIKTMTELKEEAIAPLSKIYHNSTVEEWVADKLDNNIAEAVKTKTFIEQVQNSYDEMLEQQETIENETANSTKRLHESRMLEKHLPNF